MIKVVSSGQASRSPDLMTRVPRAGLALDEHSSSSSSSSSQQRKKDWQQDRGTSHSCMLNLPVLMLTAFGRGENAKLSVTDNGRRAQWYKRYGGPSPNNESLRDLFIRPGWSAL
jgi:hypothetical protein